MALDYLTELKKFSDGGGTDINAFLNQHTLPQQTTPGAPNPGQSNAVPPTPAPISAVPIAPAPIAADTVTPAPAAAATAAMTPPVIQPAPPPLIARPEISPRPIQSDTNVVRQALRTDPAMNQGGGGVNALPRNPIASRNLYPPVADQGRILGTTTERSTPMTAAEKQGQNQFDKTFGFTPAPAAKAGMDWSSDHTGEFGSGWKPPGTATASPSVAAGGKRVAEADSPPGAGGTYYEGPLANPPRPTPSPRPTPTRVAAAEPDLPPGTEGTYYGGPFANPRPSPTPAPQNRSAVAALPRSRNQRMANTTVPRIFARAA